MNLVQYNAENHTDLVPRDDGTLWDDKEFSLADLGVWAPWIDDDIADDVERGEVEEGNQWQSAWIGTRGFVDQETGQVMVEEFQTALDGEEPEPGDPYPVEEEPMRLAQRMDESNEKAQAYYRYVADKGIDPLGEFFVERSQRITVTASVTREGDDEARIKVNPDLPETRAWAHITEQNGISSSSFSAIQRHHQTSGDHFVIREAVNIPRAEALIAADLVAAAKRSMLKT